MFSLGGLSLFLENTEPLTPSDGAREKMGDLKRFENSVKIRIVSLHDFFIASTA